MGARGAAAAVASVLALAAACGGRIDEEVGTTTVGGPRAGAPEPPGPVLTPSPSPATLDAGRALDASTDDAGCGRALPPPGTTCPSPPPPAPLVYVAAAPFAAACSSEDVTFLGTTIHGNAQITPADLASAMAARSMACASCIFGDVCAPAWSPFVFRDASRTTGFVDFGGCVERAGGSLACATAIEAQQLCLDAVCPAGACGSAAITCRQKAQSASGACPSGPVSTACAAEVALVESACPDFVAVVRASCGPSADAGP